MEPAVWTKRFEKDSFCLPLAILYTCLGFLIQMLTLQVEDAVLVLQNTAVLFLYIGGKSPGSSGAH